MATHVKFTGVSGDCYIVPMANLMIEPEDYQSIRVTIIGMDYPQWVFPNVMRDEFEKALQENDGTCGVYVIPTLEEG